MASGAWRDFWDFVSKEHDLRASAAKAAAASPVADLVLNLGPPWPHHTFVLAVTALVEVVVYLLAYEILANWVARLRSVLIWSTGAAVAAGFLYLALFARFVQPAPDYWHRVVVGREVRPEVAELYKGSSLPSARDLLKKSGNQEDKVWTESSLNCMRVLVLVVWLALYALVTLLFSAFVLLRRAQAGPSAPGGQPGPPAPGGTAAPTGPTGT